MSTKQRVVAPAGPGGLISGEQGVDLGLGEVGDKVALGPLVRDREHPLDRPSVLGVMKRHVREQRVDRREAVVAGADAVAAMFLEMVQERQAISGASSWSMSSSLWTAPRSVDTL